MRVMIRMFVALFVVGAFGAVVTAAPAAADTGSTVTITGPAEGDVFSRSTTPMLQVAGGVEFDSPIPADRTYYAGRFYTSIPSRLSTSPTGDGVGAQWTDSATPLNELSDTPTQNTYETTIQDRVDFTLDASRSLSGVVAHASFNVEDAVQIGVGLTEIDITVTAEEVGGEVRPLGRTTVSYLATPSLTNHEMPWQVALPAELGKRDFTGKVTLTLVVRGYNALHGYTVPDETNVTVPIYTASFDRRVEVAVDDGPFTSGTVSIAEEATAWFAAIPTPPPGAHTIKARAVQGWRTSLTSHDGWVSKPRTSPVAASTIGVIE